MTAAALFEKITYKVVYNYGISGGSVRGEAVQTVAYGENSKTVTAVPDEGYRFLRWSDGLESAERTDTDVRAELLLTPYFEVITFKAVYTASENGTVVGPNTGFEKRFELTVEYGNV